MKTLRTLAWSAAARRAVVVVLAVLAVPFLAPGCDEDRPTPVAATPPAGPNPNGPPTTVASKEKNPISGHRKSTLGKAYDVAEDLVDNKIPEYNRKLEEELKKK